MTITQKKALRWLDEKLERRNTLRNDLLKGAVFIREHCKTDMELTKLVFVDTLERYALEEEKYAAEVQTEIGMLNYMKECVSAS